MPNLASFLQHNIGHSSHRNQTQIRQQSEIKGIQTAKEELKLSLIADDILYIENSKDSTKKLLGLIIKFSKVAEYKINIQISVAFLGTNKAVSERELKKTIPFATASKIMKYLGTNLTKEVKDLYYEN